jgi:hypothetical protein
MIKKIEYNLQVFFSVDKQPTIAGQCCVTGDIFFEDGRIIKNVEFGWGDCPAIESTEEDKFTQEEIEMINEMIDDADTGFWDGCYKLTEKLSSSQIVGVVEKP